MVAWPYNSSTVSGLDKIRTADTAPTISDLGTISASGTATLTLDTNSAFKLTAGGDFTLTHSGTIPSTQVVQGIIEITNGGAHTITYDSDFKFTDGTAPVLTASGVDVLSFISFGSSTDIYLFHVGRDLS
tara:strand:+ start:962 stop:1351 length:390 start_codon:yes stop_codon:yes gene_type:complete